MNAGDHDYEHYVYRCYDAADRLLYIGCTEDIGSRFAVHYAQWTNPASRVLARRMDRYEVTTYPTKAEARAAEKQAIHDEAPLLNLHHQRERRTSAERAALIDSYMEATRPAPNPELLAVLSKFGGVA